MGIRPARRHKTHPRVVTALEGAFKLVAPEVDRLLIHPEPATDNRR